MWNEWKKIETNVCAYDCNRIPFRTMKLINVKNKNLDILSRRH